jgi:multimeric flavodoxin WrbA
MKVLMINGSPNPKGCISTAFDIAAEELAAAGMSNEHLMAYLGYYQKQQKKGGSGGGKDVTKTKDYKNNLYSALTDLEKGKTVEEVNHDILNLVKSGKLDAETAGVLMAAITKEGYK